MASAWSIARFTYWGFRAVADTVQGYDKRGSAREKAVTNRFDVRGATAIETEYHQALAAVDKRLEASQAPEHAPLRVITVHYRMLGGTYRMTGAGTMEVPIIAPTSHWGVQIGDYFYELRQKRDRNDDIEGGGHQEPIDVQEEGDKVKLAMTRNKFIVDGTESIHVGETRLSDVQIMGRASYIFKRLFATSYNVLIDKDAGPIRIHTRIATEERHNSGLSSLSTMQTCMSIGLIILISDHREADTRREPVDEAAKSLDVVSGRILH